MDLSPDTRVLTTVPHPGTMLITLNRPDARNAIDLPTAEAIAAALDRLDDADDLAVGVITGAGSGFCAGMDLKAFAATGEKPRVGDRGFAGIVRRASRKPLIAAVEGFALAGGLEIALACDLLVAARGAKLGIPEARLGLVAAGGALRQLPRRIPANIAAEMAFTGAPIDAQRGYELGLVNELTAKGDALPAALAMSRVIAGNAPLALEASKRVLAEQADWASADFWERQSAITEPVLNSEDAREGARAFVERRAAQWARR